MRQLPVLLQLAQPCEPSLLRWQPPLYLSLLAPERPAVLRDQSKQLGPISATNLLFFLFLLGLLFRPLFFLLSSRFLVLRSTSLASLFRFSCIFFILLYPFDPRVGVEASVHDATQPGYVLLFPASSLRFILLFRVPLVISAGWLAVSVRETRER